MSFRTAYYIALTMLAAAAATSCIENNRETGGGILPEGLVPELGIKTFELPVTNRASDSVQASNSSNMLIGTLTDPTYGTVTMQRGFIHSSILRLYRLWRQSGTDRSISHTVH